MRHSNEHKAETFTHVPKSVSEDVEITIKPNGNQHYTLTPFPFEGSKLEVNCKGRYFEAVSLETPTKDLGKLLYGLPTERQTFVFLN